VTGDGVQLSGEVRVLVVQIEERMFVILLRDGKRTRPSDKENVIKKRKSTKERSKPVRDAKRPCR
jgi:hypothetical protein